MVSYWRRDVNALYRVTDWPELQLYRGTECVCVVILIAYRLSIVTCVLHPIDDLRWQLHAKVPANVPPAI